MLKILFLFLSIGAFAHNYDEKRCLKVVDRDGNPLVGVSVFNKNLRLSTVTQNDGCIYLQGTRVEQLHFDKEGYLPLVLQSKIFPKSMKITLYENPQFPDLVKITGNLSPFQGVKDYDGMIDIGLGFTAFKIEDFFQFSPSQFVSQYQETIDIFGERKVPSNLYFPKQMERYLVNIKLQKESYTILVPKQESVDLGAIHAKVPLKTVIDYAQDKISIVDLFNKVSFINSGSQLNIVSTQDQNKVDIGLNLSAQKTVTINNQVGPSETPINISLARVNNKYVPVDMSMKTGSSTLRTYGLDSKIITGNLTLNDKKEPQHGQIAVFPNIAKSKIKGVILNDELSIETNNQYFMIYFIKVHKRVNPTYNFNETHPQIVHSVISDSKSSNKIALPKLAYDHIAIVGLDMKPGTTIKDIGNLDNNLIQASFHVLKGTTSK